MSDFRRLFIWVCVGIVGYGCSQPGFLHGRYPVSGVSSMRFLITVNDTWNPEGCIATVATPPLIPGKQYNKSDSIRVGVCDNGPMRFQITNSPRVNTLMEINLTFFSSVIEDASPPTCSIQWNGTYLTPSKTGPGQSLLPGCFVMDSREANSRDMSLTANSSSNLSVYRLEMLISTVGGSSTIMRQTTNSDL
ncbi:hypothetical protein ScPMuIL_018656 [Solemya velum]